MNIEVEVPDLGLDGGDQATVVEWHFDEAESVQEGECLLELECESGGIEIMSPVTGVLVERVVEEDEIVRVGELLAILEARSDSEFIDDEDEL